MKKKIYAILDGMFDNAKKFKVIWAAISILAVLSMIAFLLLPLIITL